MASNTDALTVDDARLEGEFVVPCSSVGDRALRAGRRTLRREAVLRGGRTRRRLASTQSLGGLSSACSALADATASN